MSPHTPKKTLINKNISVFFMLKRREKAYGKN